jgi:hypothetical protein
MSASYPLLTQLSSKLTKLISAGEVNRYVCDAV